MSLQYMALVQKGPLFKLLTAVGVMLERPDAPSFPSGRSISGRGGS
jgi:hypothetical protein